MHRQQAHRLHGIRGQRLAACRPADRPWSQPQPFCNATTASLSLVDTCSRATHGQTRWSTLCLASGAPLQAILRRFGLLECDGLGSNWHKYETDLECRSCTTTPVSVARISLRSGSANADFAVVECDPISKLCDGSHCGEAFVARIGTFGRMRAGRQGPVCR